MLMNISRKEFCSETLDVTQSNESYKSLDVYNFTMNDSLKGTARIWNQFNRSRLK